MRRNPRKFLFFLSRACRSAVKCSRSRLSYLLPIIAVIALLVSGPDQKVRSTICIIGSTDKIETADRVHEVWGSQFPTTYYLWSSRSRLSLAGKSSLVRTVSDGKRSTFKRGTEFVAFYTRRNYDCEYLFVHDDDLRFSLVQHLARSADIASEILRILSIYKPSYATFPWEAAYLQPNVRRYFDFHENSEVFRFTAGDIGMSLYHDSVFDFFFPFSPNGEGNFTSEWTLMTHFVDLFASEVWDSIVVNSIRYQNTISPNKQPNLKWHILPNGTAVNQVSRHLYEWPLNSKYIRFLYSCSRNLSLEHARDKFISSRVAPRRVVQTIEEMQTRLAEKFDVRHPALASCHQVHQQEIYEKLVHEAREFPFKSTVTLFCTKDCLEMMKHFRTPHAGQMQDMRVIVARQLQPREQESIRNFLDDLGHISGVEVVSDYTSRESIWNPSDLDSFNMILENLHPSSLLLATFHRAVRTVFYGEVWKYDDIWGICLSSEYSDGMHSIHLSQEPCSAAFVISAYGWTSFRNYLRVQENRMDLKTLQQFRQAAKSYLTFSRQSIAYFSGFQQSL